jgi:ribosomal protein S18 acetylase RimI-like enzyme
MSDRFQLVYTSYDDVLKDEGQIIDAGLDASNEASAPLQDVVALSCFARSPTGTVIGGAIGRRWGSCCELQQLWVNPDYRRSGIGRQLVQEFQHRAELRGCKTFYLETFSFQAPSLYLSLGYETKLELQGFPANIVKYVMVREVGKLATEG